MSACLDRLGTAWSRQQVAPPAAGVPTMATPFPVRFRSATPENPPPRRARRARRPHGAVRRLGHAGRVLRHHRRAHGRAHARPACSTSATWARSRSPARTRWRRSSTSRPQRRLAGSQVGQIQYSALPTPEGTFVDDLLVYRWAPTHFLLVVNAGNIEKDYAWIAGADRRRRRRRRRELERPLRADRVQGPTAREVLQPLTGVDLAGDQVLLVRARRSRRRPRHRLAHRLHRRGRLRDLRAAGAGRRASGTRCSRPGSRRASIPAGLGARDTLRLEAGDAPVRQRHRRDDHACSRPTSAGSSAGRRPTSSAATCCARRRRAARRASSSASR